MSMDLLAGLKALRTHVSSTVATEKGVGKSWISGLSFLLVAVTIALPANAAETVSMGGAQLESIKTGKLYPEGLEYNPKTGNFLLASFREGMVYEVEPDGTFRPLVQDDRLTTGMGIRVDAKNNRLYVVSSDIGISVRQSSEGKFMRAALGIYELSSGKAINFINLDALRPKGEKHIANDLAVDPEGNVYVTDSLAPIIYKVDLQGRASVFLEDKNRFIGKGFNLNGIIYHPDGYLIVAKKNEGVLFKVPVDEPEKYTEIKAPRKFTGADGLILLDNNNVVVVTNRAAGILNDTAFALNSKDGWKTSTVSGYYKFTKDEYPTTGIVNDGKIFVVYGRINRLLSAKKEEKEAGYPQKATIQQVGNVKP